MKLMLLGNLNPVQTRQTPPQQIHYKLYREVIPEGIYWAIEENIITIIIWY